MVTGNRVRWNFHYNPGDINVEWYFAIINQDKRARNLIKNRIIEHFQPVDELQNLEGKTNSGNNYLLIVFLAGKKFSKRDQSKIFEGKILQDGGIYRREKTGLDGLAAYIETNF